jgi:hypothetical protein
MATRVITAPTGHGSGDDDTLKVQLILDNDGRIWDNVGNDLEPFVLAQITRYDIAVTETAAGSGIYTYTVPDELPSGTYRERPRFTDGDYLQSRDPFKWTGSTVPAGGGGSRFLTVAQARARLRDQAANAGDTDVYEDDSLDNALQHVINDFVLDTDCLRQTDSLTLTSGSSTIDASSIDGFRSAFIKRAWIVGQDPIEITDHGQVLELAKCKPRSAAPLLVGFSDWTSGDCWPTPDQTYTLKLSWAPPATIWTPGDDDDVVINIPADLLIPIITYGATSALQHAEKAQRYASESWRKYESFKARRRNAGSLGAQITASQPLV